MNQGVISYASTERSNVKSHQRRRHLGAKQSTIGRDAAFEPTTAGFVEI